MFEPSVVSRLCLLTIILLQYALITFAAADTLYFKREGDHPRRRGVEPAKCNIRCTEGHPCCQLHHGAFACCAHKNGTCCSNGFHCCPAGTRCNLRGMTCDPVAAAVSDSQSPPTQPRQLLRRLDNRTDVICGGGNNRCPADTTCCGGGGGGGGSRACCPFPAGVCCGSKANASHCCPGHARCVLRPGASDNWHCDTLLYRSSAYPTFAALDTTPAKPLSTPTPSRPPFDPAPLLRLRTPVICPGGNQTCNEGETCCLLRDGTYGCCPFPKAVCCSDKQHCCPANHTCDVAHSRCLPQSGAPLGAARSSAPRPRRVRAGAPGPASRAPRATYVTCPGGQAECPQGDTCCRRSGGGGGDRWACCGLPDAVCCTDGQHCCPKGAVCDLRERRCVKPQAATGPDAEPGAVPDVIPDAVPDVVPDAVQADVVQAATTAKTTCPGGSYTCGGGETCCRQSGSVWGCCPLPNATCCPPSHGGCCPQKFACDTAKPRCIPKGDADAVTAGEAPIRLVRRSAPGRPGVRPAGRDIVCPGGEYRCAVTETCCLQPGGGRVYGCCPQAGASCCPDGVHCCPGGYWCDPAAQKCRRTKAAAAGQMGSTDTQIMVFTKKARHKRSVSKLNVLRWSVKRPAELVDTRDVSRDTPVSRDVLCPGGQYRCPKGQTCCQLASGQWGCCSLPRAVCCPDGVHCCPHGYRCNVSHASCDKKPSAAVEERLQDAAPRHTMPASSDALATLYRRLNIRIALSELKRDLQAVRCAGNAYCPRGNVCCPGRTVNDVQCCPHAKGVCCPSGRVCCPHNTRCERSPGSELEICVP